MNSVRTRAPRNLTRVPMPDSMVRPLEAVAHDDEVARRAYTLYEQRNCADGHDVEDWLSAERDVRGIRPPTAD